jgi:hypothetical protein
MTNVNILVTAEHLEPGDNWTEIDGYTYVVYANEALSGSVRDIKVIQIKDGQCKPIQVRRFSNESRLVVDRPK